jgi:hypothetical protein
MRSSTIVKFVTSAVIAAGLAGAGSPALAQDPDYMVVYDPGWACQAFALKIEGWFGNHHDKTFREKNGYVRSIQVGTGDSARFTNLATGKTLTTDSSGVAWRTTTYLPDGSAKFENAGHSVLVLWPTDITPGPSTTLYTGRVTITANSAGQYKLESVSGRAVDVCAALS